MGWAPHKYMYHVYVTTSEYTGATGQCSQGKLRRRRLDVSGGTSGGVAFPSGNEVKVSKEQAEAACAGLKEQKQNCVTDMRMVNEPEAVVKIREDFQTVETTVKALEAASLAVVSGATTTHLRFAALAVLVASLAGNW